MITFIWIGYGSTITKSCWVFLSGASFGVGWQWRCGERDCVSIWPSTSPGSHSCRYWCTVLLTPPLPIIPCSFSQSPVIRPSTYLPSNPRKLPAASGDLCSYSSCKHSCSYWPSSSSSSTFHPPEDNGGLSSLPVKSSGIKVPTLPVSSLSEIFWFFQLSTLYSCQE